MREQEKVVGVAAEVVARDVVIDVRGADRVVFVQNGEYQGESVSAIDFANGDGENDVWAVTIIMDHGFLEGIRDTLNKLDLRG